MLLSLTVGNISSAEATSPCSLRKFPQDFLIILIVLVRNFILVSFRNFNLLFCVCSLFGSRWGFTCSFKSNPYQKPTHNSLSTWRSLFYSKIKCEVQLFTSLPEPRISEGMNSGWTSSHLPMSEWATSNITIDCSHRRNLELESGVFLWSVLDILLLFEDFPFPKLIM